MKKSIVHILFLCFISLGNCFAQQPKRDSIVFVSVNDIHAALDQFPRFAYMVDSLRSIYPSLFLVGAGDYNSGNPINDYYNPKGYPTIALMNAVGFDVSAVGNHEFDVTQEGFGLLTRLATFPFVAANVFPDPKFGIELQPYVIKQLPSGKKVAFLGMLQIEADGLPSTHHEKLTGIQFSLAHDLMPQYHFLRDSADLVVMVTHLGLDDDRILARNNPWVDLIIGGHSHTLVKGADWVGEVPITQSKSRLKYMALTTIVLENGKKVSTTIETLPIVSSHGKVSQAIQKRLAWLSRDPYFQQEIAVAEAKFQNAVQLGFLMCDAYRLETASDFSFQNFGGVRMDSLPQGPIKILDIYTLDPFGNEMMTVKLTGEEVENFVKGAWTKDYNHPIYSSGLHIKYYTDKAGNLKKVELRDAKGKLLHKKKEYQVAFSNYIQTAYPFTAQNKPLSFQGKSTAEVTIDYLKRQAKVEDYSTQPIRFEIVTK